MFCGLDRHFIQINGIIKAERVIYYNNYVTILLDKFGDIHVLEKYCRLKSFDNYVLEKDGELYDIEKTSFPKFVNLELNKLLSSDGKIYKIMCNSKSIMNEKGDLYISEYDIKIIENNKYVELNKRIVKFSCCSMDVFIQCEDNTMYHVTKILSKFIAKPVKIEGGDVKFLQIGECPARQELLAIDEECNLWTTGDRQYYMDGSVSYNLKKTCFSAEQLPNQIFPFTLKAKSARN